MLAQNFKTAAVLGITDLEQQALIKVLGMLERNEVQHVDVKDIFYSSGLHLRSKPDKSLLFNMANIYTVAACGTAACIAGTADLFCGSSFVDGHHLRNGLPPALVTLFCPDVCCEDDWEKITTQQAATALRSYLTTGDARWDLALA